MKGKIESTPLLNNRKGWMMCNFKLILISLLMVLQTSAFIIAKVFALLQQMNGKAVAYTGTGCLLCQS